MHLLMSVLVVVAALLQLLAAVGAATTVRGQHRIPRSRLHLLGALNLGAFVLLVAALLTDAV
ncbi:hypothetical protein GCM10027174_03610 [Salinifilum aidingensis]